MFFKCLFTGPLPSSLPSVIEVFELVILVSNRKKENDKFCGIFHSIFKFSSIFLSVVLTWYEHRTCFLFHSLLENSTREIKENTVATFLTFYFAITTSTACASSLFHSIYWSMALSACFLSGCFFFINYNSYSSKYTVLLFFLASRIKGKPKVKGILKNTWMEYPRGHCTRQVSSCSCLRTGSYWKY